MVAVRKWRGRRRPHAVQHVRRTVRRLRPACLCLSLSRIRIGVGARGRRVAGRPPESHVHAQQPKMDRPERRDDGDRVRSGRFKAVPVVAAMVIRGRARSAWRRAIAGLIGRQPGKALCVGETSVHGAAETVGRVGP